MNSPLDFGLATLPHSLPAGHQRLTISSGPTGTAQTIRRMASLVTQGKRDFRIRTLAGQLIRKNCQQKDYPCYGKSLYEFCRDQIQYVWDPNGVELIEEPWKIIESGIADCDSIVVLLASLAESCGFPCKFVTIKSDPAHPNEYTHVYLRMKLPPMGWVAADPTMHENTFGWEPPDTMEKTEWNASDDPPEDADPNDGMNIPSLPSANAPAVTTQRGYQMRLGSLSLGDDGSTNIPAFLPGEGSGQTEMVPLTASQQAAVQSMSAPSMFTPANVLVGIAAAYLFYKKKYVGGATALAALYYLNKK